MNCDASWREGDETTHSQQKKKGGRPADQVAHPSLSLKQNSL